MGFLSFAEKSPQRSHQLYLSSSQGSISCKCNVTVFRGKRSQTCNHRPWKNHRSQPPGFARSTEFVRQYQINTNLTLAANNPHALTFAPSLILLAAFKSLPKDSWSPHYPAKKKMLSLAKVRKAEHREEHKCSWVPCLPWVTFDPTNCSAVQTSGKQPLSEGRLPTHLNYLGKDAIKRPPVSWQKEIWIFVMKGKSPTVIAALRL